jgi:Helix-turn-helix.
MPLHKSKHFPMGIQDRILQIIEHSGLSRNAFSNKTGIQPQTLHHIVSGRRTKPSFDVLEKIATTFPEIDLTWLLTGEYEMTHTNVDKKMSGDSVEDLSQTEIKEIDALLDKLDLDSFRKQIEIIEILKHTNNVDDVYANVLDFMGNLDMCDKYLSHYYYGHLSDYIEKYLKKEITQPHLLKAFKDNVEKVKVLNEIIKPYEKTISSLYYILDEYNANEDRIYHIEE